MNAKRRLKKIVARGRIATPTAVLQPGDTTWIPNVPALHEGTANDPAHSGMSAVELQQHLSQSQLPPSSPPPVDLDAYIGISDGDLLIMALGGDQVALAILEQKGKFGFGATTGGGGTGTSLQDTLAILTAQQDFDQLQAELDRAVDQQRADDALAIATGNRLSAEKIESQRRFMEALRLRFDQSRTTLDRAIQQQQLNQATRAQDIGQRDTDIAAGLDASGQRLQGQIAGAGQLGTLAGLEQSRQQNLQQLAANPRNFMQFLFASGQGQNFLETLSGGGTPRGFNPASGQSPLTQGDFGSLQGLISQIGVTPAFTTAFGASRNLENFQTPALPGQVGAPGPRDVLSPDQQAIFDQFRASAPDIPIDIALQVARNPAAFRQLFAGLPAGTLPPPPPPPPPGTGLDIAALFQQLGSAGLMSATEFATWLSNDGTVEGLFGILVVGGRMSAGDFATLISQGQQAGAIAGQPTGGIAGQQQLTSGASGGTTGGGVFGTREFGEQFAPALTADVGGTNNLSPFLFNPSSPTAEHGQPGFVAFRDANPPDPITGRSPLPFANPDFAVGRGVTQRQFNVLSQLDPQAAPRVVQTQSQLSDLIGRGLLPSDAQTGVPNFPAPPQGPGSSDLRDALGGINVSKSISNIDLSGVNLSGLDIGLGTKFKGLDFSNLSLAGGGDVLIKHPTVAIDMVTGQPVFTMGEPTQKFPQGIPEIASINGNKLTVTPPSFAHGGTAELQSPIPDQPQPIGPPLQQRLPQEPAPQPFAPKKPAPINDPIANIQTAGQSQFGQLGRNLISLRPDVREGLGPTASQLRFSILSSLGFPPEDIAFFDQRADPRGLDPSRILTAGF